MKHLTALTVAAALALAPGWSAAWRAMNRQEVLPVSNSVFEVVARAGSGPADFWCAAGDYAYRGLGTPAVQRVYVWRGIGPSVNRPGYKAMQFSLTPPPGADTSPSLTLSLRRIGDNLRAASAQQYCYSELEDRDWLN